MNSNIIKTEKIQPKSVFKQSLVAATLEIPLQKNSNPPPSTGTNFEGSSFHKVINSG